MRQKKPSQRVHSKETRQDKQVWPQDPREKALEDKHDGERLSGTTPCCVSAEYSREPPTHRAGRSGLLGEEKARITFAYRRVGCGIHASKT
jgi:hypothetical protein